MYLSSEDHFKSFYIECFPSVRTYIWAKCGNAQLAEDLAQEAFIRLWDNKNKVEACKAKSFVFKVSNNLFLDYIRHTKVVQSYSLSEIKHQNDLDPQFIFDLKEFQKRIDLILESMPEKAREVFLLNRMDKLTYNQIAEVLGMSVKTVEKRMQKALEIFSKLKVNP